MTRVLEQDGCRGLFDDTAQIHHCDTRADLAHDTQVMADEHHPKPATALQINQQVHHLRLNRHIQRRDRLVTDQQIRIGDQRACDHDPLALPARQFVRIALTVIGGQAHGCQRVLSCLMVIPVTAVDRQRFDDLVQHRQTPVQRAKRVLKHHLHPAAQTSPNRGAIGRHRPAVEVDRSLIRWLQPQRHTAKGGFAGTGFADNAQGLASRHLKADPVHRAHKAALAK